MKWFRMLNSQIVKTYLGNHTKLSIMQCPQIEDGTMMMVITSYVSGN